MDYPWCSYRQYLLEFSGESTYLDAELIVGFFLTRDFVNLWIEKMMINV